MSDVFASLPIPRSELVGREAALEQIIERVRADCPLLTITGTGGIGKTRLAITAAQLLQEEFGGRVAFVQLADVIDHHHVADAIATALRVQAPAGQSLETAITNALGFRRTLLVLDNLEHVLPAAPMIGRITQASPLVNVLTTSRTPLDITGEALFELSPLPADSPESASVYLFAARATAAFPGFIISDTNVEAVMEICRFLDGIPLAIELAASRAPLLDPTELAERLRRAPGTRGQGLTGLRLLASHAADRHPRHRALHGTISWSVELLSPPQRRLLNRLVVFEGGWTLDAAEFVGQASDGADTDADADDADAAEVFEALGSLLAHHLIVRDESAGALGQPRYRMLETIRQFVVETCASVEDVDHARRRHAAYFARLAHEAGTGLESADEATWTGRLEREDANLRAALHTLDGVGDVHGCLAMVAALGRHWRNSGRWDIGQEWLNRYYERSLGTGAPAEVVADALGWIGRLAIESGVIGDERKGVDAALDAIDESLTIARTAGDPQLLLRSTEAAIAAAAADDGFARRARPLCLEAIALSTAINDRWWQAMLESWRGVHLRLDGDLVGAELSATTCRALARSDGNRHMAGLGGWVLSSVLLEARRFDEAETVLVEALDDNLSARDRRSASFCYLSLGSIAVARGDLCRAARNLRSGLLLAQESSDWVGAGFGLMSLFALAARTGHHRHAARIWGGIERDVEALCRIYPSQRRAVDRAESASRNALGAVEFDLLAHHGRQLGWRDATIDAIDVANLVDGPDPTTSEPDTSATVERRVLHDSVVPPTSTNPDRLSRREIDVLRLIASGSTNNDIGQLLYVSIGTVERHIANLYRKIGARRRADATVYALRNGFVES